MTNRTGPVVAAVVDGERIAWCDGVFRGDKGIARWCRRRVKSALPVETPTGWRDCEGGATPMGALSAMWAYCPGRVTVCEAPDGLIDGFFAVEHVGADEEDPVDVDESAGGATTGGMDGASIQAFLASLEGLPPREVDERIAEDVRDGTLSEEDVAGEAVH